MYQIYLLDTNRGCYRWYGDWQDDDRLKPRQFTSKKEAEESAKILRQHPYYRAVEVKKV